MAPGEGVEPPGALRRPFLQVTEYYGPFMNMGAWTWETPSDVGTAALPLSYKAGFEPATRSLEMITENYGPCAIQLSRYPYGHAGVIGNVESAALPTELPLPKQRVGLEPTARRLITNEIGPYGKSWAADM